MTPPPGTTSIIGFDSAWTDTVPGALCILRFAPQAGWSFTPATLARFDDALAAITAEQVISTRCVVAIDQPTIVPNQTGSRPADRVAAAVISFIGGGVQPAFRAKASMFGDAAPIWRFKTTLGASDDAEQARTASTGTFLFEVFPALALASFADRFHARRAHPKYNPANRQKFQHEHWLAVIDTVAEVGQAAGIAGLANWCKGHRLLAAPGKADQDRLDAVLCALIAHHWLEAPRSQSIRIGDSITGFMIAPASASVRQRLETAACHRNVPIDGKIL